MDEPENPEFDTMSQAELIEWLKQLMQDHDEATALFAAEDAASDAWFEAQAEDEGDDISAAEDAAGDAWLEDEDEGDDISAAEDAAGDAWLEDEDEGDDIFVLDSLASDSPAPPYIDWLDDPVTDNEPEEAIDFWQLPSADSPPDPADSPLDRHDEEDPLAWLHELPAQDISPPFSLEPPISAHVAGTTDASSPEDPGEYESIFSTDEGEEGLFEDWLLGMDGWDEGPHSTQAIAPPPLEPDSPAAAIAPSQSESTDAGDTLADAFTGASEREDLEAWYAQRLQAIGSRAEGQQAAAALSAPEPEPPPPGLAAAINSARGKIHADALPAALQDYEKLYGSSAGLEWVVRDMRGLLQREKYRAEPSVHRVLGDALMRQGHLDAALQAYQQALALL